MSENKYPTSVYSAAPEMLEALLGVHRWYKSIVSITSFPCIHAVDEALAKAHNCHERCRIHSESCDWSCSHSFKTHTNLCTENGSWFTHGTAWFPTFADACDYYAPYYHGDPEDSVHAQRMSFESWVQNKVSEGSIHIGKPPCEKNEYAFLKRKRPADWIPALETAADMEPGRRWFITKYADDDATREAVANATTSRLEMSMHEDPSVREGGAQ